MFRPPACAPRAQALGPDIELMVDAHGTYTVAEAKRFIHLVADCDLAWFEEPVIADDKAGMAEVRAAGAVPDRHRRKRGDALRLPRPRRAEGGRHLPARPGLLRRHQRGDAASAPSPAPSICASRRICGPARRASSPGLHVCAASPASFIVEYSLGANPMIHDLIEETVEAKDGMIAIPERPGLGFTDFGAIPGGSRASS